MNYTSKGLYRYAGGKNKRKEELISLIYEVKPNITTMMSPFFGGGSVEILMSSKGVKVRAYDLYQPLADFWEIVTTEGGKRIADTVREHIPLRDREHYKSFLPLMDSDDKFTRAWSFYICIKGAFSGDIGHTSELSRQNLSPAGLQKLVGFYNPNLTFTYGDCFEKIPEHKDDFLFLDPPYFATTGFYYGKDGSTHEGFDHKKLAELLREHRGGFVMTYDNSDYLKELYHDFTEFRYMEFDYQMAGDANRRGKKIELIVIKRPNDVTVDELSTITCNPLLDALY